MFHQPSWGVSVRHCEQEAGQSSKIMSPEASFYIPGSRRSARDDTCQNSTIIIHFHNQTTINVCSAIFSNSQTILKIHKPLKEVLFYLIYSHLVAICILELSYLLCSR